MALAERDKVQIGMGAYLLRNKPDAFKEQLDSLYTLSPSGIVIFSYDDLVRDPALLK